MIYARQLKIVCLLYLLVWKVRQVSLRFVWHITCRIVLKEVQERYHGSWSDVFCKHTSKLKTVVTAWRFTLQITWHWHAGKAPTTFYSISQPGNICVLYVALTMRNEGGHDFGNLNNDSDEMVKQEKKFLFVGPIDSEWPFHGAICIGCKSLPTFHGCRVGEW